MMNGKRLRRRLLEQIVGTVKGRIFMAGGDGNMYELLYEHEGDSFFSMGRAVRCCQSFIKSFLRPVRLTFAPGVAHGQCGGWCPCMVCFV